MSTANRSLTEYALAGWQGSPNPHINTSPAWYAHYFGEWLNQNGQSLFAADEVCMSRGDSIRLGKQRFSFRDDGRSISFAPIY